MLSDIPTLLDDIGAGRMVILMDDEAINGARQSLTARDQLHDLD